MHNVNEIFKYNERQVFQSFAIETLINDQISD